MGFVCVPHIPSVTGTVCYFGATWTRFRGIRAGTRLGTKELESASLTVQEVAEAAVVPVADEIKGRVPDVYVSLKPGHDASDEIAAKVKAAIDDAIGKIARPKNVHIAVQGVEKLATKVGPADIARFGEE